MTIAPPDAWALARIVADQPVNGELAVMSAAWRPLADRLASSAPADRQTILDGFLTGRPDQAAILRAIADQDPTGPPPDPSVEASPGPTERGDIRPTARLTRAADITPRAVEWLWSGRVPLGMLSLWGGDPKLGKSYATLGLAAAVSRGAPMPHGDVPDGPGSVVLLSAEDDPARVIVPRLKAAGADLSKIHILESIVLADGSEALPSLRADVAAIEAAADRLGDCRLIVIDPVSSYLGGTDDHRNAELRGVLSPLKAMAARLNVAVVLVTHLSKSGGTNGKHRVIGSIAYVGACRANFLFAKDRNDATGRHVLMLDNGGNLAPPAPTLAYIIEDRGDGPRVEWLDEPVAITVDEALAAEQAACQADRAAPERRDAEEWLKELLGAGPVLAGEIKDLSKSCPFGWRTIQEVKRSLGVVADRKGFGRDGQWYWRLPDASNH